MLLLVTGYLKVPQVPFILNPGLDLALLETSEANTWSSSPRSLLSFHIDFSNTCCPLGISVFHFDAVVDRKDLSPLKSSFPLDPF